MDDSCATCPTFSYRLHRERRICYIAHQSWTPRAARAAGPSGVAALFSETRYYMKILPERPAPVHGGVGKSTGVHLFIPAIFDIRNFDRCHWQLENECHWLL